MFILFSASKPSCPKGILQWQHGEYTIEPNGTLVLNPFSIDGRQLTSDPCKSKNAEYYRYNQTEVFDVRNQTTACVFGVLTPDLLYSVTRLCGTGSTMSNA